MYRVAAAYHSTIQFIVSFVMKVLVTRTLMIFRNVKRAQTVMLVRKDLGGAVWKKIQLNA